MASEAQPDSADATAFSASGVNGSWLDDDLAGIGYEAAYPFLHAPLWREAMQDQPDSYAR
jgi:hypothetical protein